MIHIVYSGPEKKLRSRMGNVFQKSHEKVCGSGTADNALRRGSFIFTKCLIMLTVAADTIWSLIPGTLKTNQDKGGKHPGSYTSPS